LHRERRERDAQGQIVATLRDYASVRDLVADLFSEGVEATVKSATREAVAAVATLGKDEVSITEIGRHLRLDKGATSRRVADAISGGYLVNREDRRGHPARIALSDPLPAETEILPLPEQLLDRCSVAALAEGIDTPLPPADCDAELAEIEI
jgi:hypothetical protein